MKEKAAAFPFTGIVTGPQDFASEATFMSSYPKISVAFPSLDFFSFKSGFKPVHKKITEYSELEDTREDNQIHIFSEWTIEGSNPQS